MRNLIVFLLGMAVAFPVIWLSNIFSPTSYVVRILDKSECRNPQYIIETKYQSISVSGEQIDYYGALVPNGAEAFIYVHPPDEKSGDFTYKVVANYSNCVTIKSEPRTVKLGWILYEFVDENNIKHTVRAR
ncbi:hypothetical protein [Flocculibacter collagenilyticus]|uniref:hypothetical protein n=1 Tax=Flocculibacter collagenilyticus TaxID=2744479 RepID=UPI0018F62854|nr:hypothetical protein [Flocculibacter collagenilyticus]